MMLVTFLQLHLFVFPHISPRWVLTTNIFFMVINYSFCKAAFSDPGYVKGVPNLEFEKLVEKLDPNCLCPNCETSYTQDSRHCYICNRCIGKFDHHCQWINNCVGRNNHHIFYLYILSLLIYFVTIDVMCIQSLMMDVDFLDNSSYNVLGIPNASLLNVNLVEFDLESSHSFWYTFTLIEVIFIASTFMLPLSYLVVI